MVSCIKPPVAQHHNHCGHMPVSTLLGGLFVDLFGIGEEEPLVAIRGRFSLQMALQQPSAGRILA